MAKRAAGPRPGGREIRGSILSGLAMHGNITPDMVSFVQFSPTLGIAAGRINKLGMDVRSFKEPLTRAIREVLVWSIEENFNAGGRPPWEPLAEATWEMRERMGWSGGDILIRSGKLRRVASQMNIWRITQNSASIPDLPQSIWYGKVHQGGYEGTGTSMKARIAKTGDASKALRQLVKEARTTQQWTHHVKSIPARPFLVFQPEDEELVQEVFMEWLEERVNAAWP